MVFAKPFITEDLNPAEQQAFDLLADKERVEAAVSEMAGVRKRMSPEELGVLAGVGVLGQYSRAHATLDARWWTRPGLAVAGLYATIELLLPLIGFVAGLAIDVAVFGGAVETLRRASPIYAAFAVGSLVFAAGIAIAPRGMRGLLISFMLAASFFASIIAADNPRFRDHFVHLFPALKGEELAREQDLARIEGEIAGLRQAIAQKDALLHPAGRPPILQDGTRDNDGEGHQLFAEIGALTTRLNQASSEAGVMRTRLEQAASDNAAQHLGKILAGIYIFCWLAASQLVIAFVAMTARVRLARQKRRAAELTLMRRFVRQLDGEDRDRSRTLVSAAILDMLMRFNRKLTERAGEDPAKLDVFTDLFQEGPLARMQAVGTDMVCDTLLPRRSPPAPRPAP